MPSTNSKPDDGLRALRKQLGTEPPPALAELEAEQLRHLADAIADVRRRQAAELAAAGEKALGHIPRVLRLPVRKVLGQ